MVELQSSKLCAWVRFLLFLKILTLTSLKPKTTKVSRRNKPIKRIKSKPTRLMYDLLSNSIHRFKRRCVKRKTKLSSVIKPFTRRLNVWGEGGSFFTYRPFVKQLSTHTGHSHRQEYPLFSTEAFIYIQQYNLTLTQKAYIESKPFHYFDVSQSGYGWLSTFSSHNSSILISKFFRHFTSNSDYDTSFKGSVHLQKKLSLIEGEGSSVVGLIPFDVLTTRTLSKLKRVLFTTSKFTRFLVKPGRKKAIRVAKKIRKKLKRNFRQWGVYRFSRAIELTYKLNMLRRLKVNTFRFKSEASAYEFYRYKFRFIRIFKGTHWNAYKPGYHQSYYGGLSHNHNTTHTQLFTPSKVLNVFCFQKYLSNDLVLESRFATAFTGYSGLSHCKVYSKRNRKNIDVRTNWRSRDSFYSYITKLIQKLYIKPLTSLKRKSKLKSKLKPKRKPRRKPKLKPLVKKQYGLDGNRESVDVLNLQNALTIKFHGYDVFELIHVNVYSVH